MHHTQNIKTHSQRLLHPTSAPRTVAGWSSPVARQAHNLKVTGSNPVPATKFQTRHHAALTGGVVVCGLSEHIRDHCDDVVFGISITVWIDRQAVDEYRQDLRSNAAAGFRDAVSRKRLSFSSNSGSAKCGRMMGAGIALISVLGRPSQLGVSRQGCRSCSLRGPSDRGSSIASTSCPSAAPNHARPDRRVAGHCRWPRTEAVGS